MTEGRRILTTAEDRRFMARALELAARLPRRPWPNPPVGALVVRDGEVVGEGAHLGPGEAHAERVALDRAGERARGATLYCTLEPCNHEGRTPPCAPTVVASGVVRVVVGVRDPNPTVSGGGLDALTAAGVTVALGVRARDCLELIWPFVCTENFRRPYVELKTAASLDGRFAPPASAAGRPHYLTGAASRADVHRRRRWVDLVLVGEETARADRPRLDGRDLPADAPCPAAEPRAGYVDSDLSLAGGLGRGEGLVFHGEGARPGAERPPAGYQLVPCALRGDRVDPAALLTAARAEGIGAVMVEGGPTLAAAFLAAGCVDTWVHYVAPQVLGDGVTWPLTGEPGEQDETGGDDAGNWHLRSTQRFGADLRMIHDRRDFAAILAAVAGEGVLRAEEGETCSPA